MPRQTVVLCLETRQVSPASLSLRDVEQSGKNKLLARGGTDTKLSYASYPNGDASLEFYNKNSRYVLIDPLRGASIYEQIGSRGTQRKICASGNQTLSLNFTMEIMKTIGVYSGS